MKNKFCAAHLDTKSRHSEEEQAVSILSQHALLLYHCARHSPWKFWNLSHCSLREGGFHMEVGNARK